MLPAMDKISFVTPSHCLKANKQLSLPPASDRSNINQNSVYQNIIDFFKFYYAIELQTLFNNSSKNGCDKNV